MPTFRVGANQYAQQHIKLSRPMIEGGAANTANATFQWMIRTPVLFPEAGVKLKPRSTVPDVTGGGTTNPLSVSGTITPAGVLQKQTNKLPAGTITPAATLVKTTLKVFTGTVTPAGALQKQINKLFAGTI